MKLSKIVDKVKKYLEKDNLKVSQEEKLLNIMMLGDESCRNCIMQFCRNFRLHLKAETYGQ